MSVWPSERHHITLFNQIIIWDNAGCDARRSAFNPDSYMKLKGSRQLLGRGGMVIAIVTYVLIYVYCKICWVVAVVSLLSYTVLNVARAKGKRNCSMPYLPMGRCLMFSILDSPSVPAVSWAGRRLRQATAQCKMKQQKVGRFSPLVTLVITKGSCSPFVRQCKDASLSFYPPPSGLLWPWAVLSQCLL